MKKIKTIAKKYISDAQRDRMFEIQSRIRDRNVFTYDKARFRKAYARLNLQDNTKDQLEGRLVFHAHAIEKGLSHHEIRYGFGNAALGNLAKNMVAYTDKGYDKASDAYQNALSVLREYLVLHEKARVEVPYVEQIFPTSILEAARDNRSELGGIVEVPREDKKNNLKKSFKDLFLNRWSVREYAPSSVDKDRVYEAIEIARKTPSICNRQSGRVEIITDKEKIAAALKIQGGMHGYDLPPMLLLVTTDTASFVAQTERNQVYVDGGLFAMALLLGLEYVSLAACPLNAMFSVKRDKAMRRALDIPQGENIIMFIAVGNFQKVSKVPKSFRYSRDAIARSTG